MNTIVEVLRLHETLEGFWYIVVCVGAAFLLINGAMVFVRRSVAERFLDGYVRSPPINLLEAVLRLVAGLGFMGASPDMKLSPFFFWFGMVLAVTAVPMVLLYAPHKRYAAWATAFAKRILTLYGLMSIALGTLIVWALL